VVRLFSIGLSFLAGIVIALFFILASFILWVNAEPRSLPMLTSAFEDALHSSAPHLSVDINTMVISWDNKHHTINLHFEDVTLTDNNKEKRGTIPNLTMRLSLLSLFQGALIPAELIVDEAKIYIGDTKPDVNFPTLQQLFQQLTEQQIFLPENFTITNTTLFFKEKPAVSTVLIPYASGTINVSKRKITFSSDIKTGEMILRAQAQLYPNGKSNITLNFSNFESGLVDQFIPADFLVSPKHSDFTLSGEANFATDNNGNLTHTEFTITEAKGKILLAKYFSEPFTFRSFTAEGFWDNGKGGKLKNLSWITEENTTIELSGTGTSTASFPAIKFTADITNFPVNNIAVFWPKDFLSTTRHWVTSRITRGTANKASGKFIITPEYVQAKKFPVDAIDATVEFTGTNLHYHDKLPEIHDAAGTVHFSGENITIDVPRGMISDSRLQNTDFTIPYFPHYVTETKYITVDGNTEGAVGDLVKFMPAASKDSAVNLATLKGNSSTNVKLSIPLSHTKLPDANDIIFDIKAKLTDISSPAIVAAIPLTEGTFSASFTGKQTTLTGTALLAGNKANISWVSHMEEGHKFDTQSVIKTTINSDKAGPLKTIVTDGKIQTELTVTTQGKPLALIADLSNAKLSFEALGHTKERGQRAYLTAQGKTIENGFSIDNFSLKNDQLSANGNALFDTNFIFKKLEFASLKSARNDVSISYTKATPPTLSIKGKILDLSSMNYSKLLDKNSDQQAIKITAQLATVLMKNNQKFTQLAATIICGVTRCNKVDINAHIAKGDTVTIALRERSAKRNLHIHSSNAGALIAALNISNNIKNGNLTINAADTSPNIMEGTLVLTDFTVEKARLLTKILTLSSLNGILERLQGQGISFDTLTAPFKLSKKIITLNQVKAVGNSLGITASGTVDMRASTLALEGTVVPAVYGMNSLIGKIPLIGNALMGGKNQGIFAANYTIKGTYENAETTVNPLSILTPGFTRNMFSIFDNKK
jgi:hypothetical protein